jgi:homoserine acetyltransferase
MFKENRNWTQHKDMERNPHRWLSGDYISSMMMSQGVHAALKAKMVMLAAEQHFPHAFSILSARQNGTNTSHRLLEEALVCWQQHCAAFDAERYLNQLGCEHLPPFEHRPLNVITQCVQEHYA